MNRLILNDLKPTLLIALLSIFFTLISFNAIAETELSALEIMERVDEESRKSTDSAFTRMKLTTCKYGKKDGKVKCAEKPRVKLVESAQINTGDDNKDYLIAMMIVIEIMRPGYIYLLLERLKELVLEIVMMKRLSLQVFLELK